MKKYLMFFGFLLFSSSLSGCDLLSSNILTATTTITTEITSEVTTSEATTISDTTITTTISSMLTTTEVTFEGYKIIFNSNGGDEIDDITGIMFGSAVVLPIPEKTGYVFNGWYLGESINAERIYDTTPITKDMTLYARWEPEIYTVKFYNDSDLLYVEYVTYGASANAPTPPVIEGYSFIGWDKVFVEVKVDLNVYAEYQLNYYDISFDSNGGNVVLDQENILHGSKINMVIPEKIGYDFLGWFDGEKLYNDRTKITSNLALKAKWATSAYLDYSFDEENYTYIVTGYYGSQSHLIIPETYQGYFVTNIDKWAINRHDNLIKITLPSSITSINDSILMNQHLEEIVIDGDNNTYYTHDNVLYSNENELILYPANRPGEIFNMPNEVVSISPNAFSLIKNLRVLNLSSNLETFDIIFFGDPYLDYQFKIEEINVVPENQYFTSIDGVLYNKDLTKLIAYPINKANTHYTVLNSVVTIGYHAFEFNRILTSIDLPEGLKHIEEAAFHMVNGVIDFNLPESLEIIGKRAFSRTRASIIVIPKNVHTIGDLAFHHSHGTGSIVVDANNPYFESKDGVLFNEDMTELIHYPCNNLRTVYIVPETVTTIKKMAFSYIFNLAYVFIPDSVTVIEYLVFEHTEMMTLLINNSSIPSTWNLNWFNVNNSFHFIFSVDGIKESIDYYYYIKEDGTAAIIGRTNDSELLDLTIPETIDTYLVNEISRFAFWRNANVSTITIPKSVDIIGEYAFAEAQITLYLEDFEKQPSWHELWSEGVIQINWGDEIRTITFDSNGGDVVEDITVIYGIEITELPIPTKDGYMFDGWYLDGEKIVLPYNYNIHGNITLIAEWIDAIDNGEFLYRILTDNTVIIVGISESNVNTVITIPNTIDTYPVTIIGKRAFEDNTDITSITIPASVIEIEYNAFKGMSWLETVTFEAGSNLEIIGDYVFKSCSSLTTIDIPEGVIVIGEYAFSYAYTLNSINLPSTLTTISNNAFEETWSLSSITIPLAVINMGSNVFKGSSVPEINCECSLLQHQEWEWAFDWNPDNITVNWDDGI